ncbi:MAG: molybdopterin-guanine dinucleotide biosynthesis protein A [Inquilinaceae bacterium]
MTTPAGLPIRPPASNPVRSIAAALLVAAACVAGPALAQDEGDRHDDYYYPKVTSSETYPSPAGVLPGSDRLRRIGFVVGVTKEQLGQAYPPRWAMFPKGTDAEKMIIVTLDRDALVTLYQARAMLAQLTSVARASPIFIQNEVEDHYTFLDLLKLLGFRQLTISDGQTYSHQFAIE